MARRHLSALEPHLTSTTLTQKEGAEVAKRLCSTLRSWVEGKKDTVWPEAIWTMRLKANANERKPEVEEKVRSLPLPGAGLMTIIALRKELLGENTERAAEEDEGTDRSATDTDENHDEEERAANEEEEEGEQEKEVEPDGLTVEYLSRCHSKREGQW
ncbi:hypothetical protein VYU27_007956 [Nannochloropsis oceanica]